MRSGVFRLWGRHPHLAGPVPLFLVVTILSFLSCVTSEGAIISVTNTNDSGAGSLRQAIVSASSGDTVRFTFTGTITLTSDSLEINKHLTIEGPSNAGDLTIARSSAGGTPAFSVFEIGLSTGSRVVHISNLTIRNGRGSGGGIFTRNRTQLTLSNCILRENVSDDRCGGAIWNFGSNLTVAGCVFMQNSAFEAVASNPTPDGGGAICNESVGGDAGALVLQDSVFDDNYAETGGGAIASYGAFQDAGAPLPSVSVSGCTFSGNTSDSYGGAIQALRGTLGVTGSLFSGNNADNNGGGIHSFATVTVDASTFSANVAAAVGGGLYNGASTASVLNSIFQGNTAQGGGGVWTQGAMSLASSTFYNNQATQGGGVLNTRDLAVTSCTFLSNGIYQSPPSGVASMELRNTLFMNSSLSQQNGTITSFGYNLSNGSGNGFLIGPGDRTNTDPGLDPLGPQNNGGPTQTIALTSGSLAIDQGHGFGLPTDQRGFARIFDHPSVPNAAGGDGADIGAFEAPADPIQSGIPSLVVTTTGDHNDGICGGGDCTLREALLRANAIPGPNVVTFAPAVVGTITLLVAQGGQLTIADSTTIAGPGARLLAIGGAGQGRLISLTSGTSVISGLTLRDGLIAGGPAGGSNIGGGILNQAVLTFQDCTFSNNRAVGDLGVPPGGSGGTGSGGAIANFGTLKVERCTFTGNGATGGAGADNPPPDDFAITIGGNGGSARGGAIFNDSGRSLTIENCTFTANNAGAAPGGSGHHGGNGGHGLGGAVHNLGTLVLSASTVSGNTGFGGSGGGNRPGGFPGVLGLGAGGIAAVGGASTLQNTISAGNSATGTFRYDVYGAFSSGGYNLIGRIDGGSGFTATGDQTGSIAAPLNAQLGALANNGGGTDTMRVLSGSPALDKGKAFNLSTDQRSQLRPSDNPAVPNASGGDGSEIGAFEISLGVFIVTTTADHNDGLCDAVDCTLREAIIAANGQLDPDIIRFAPGVTGTIQLASALPSLSSDMTLEGPGANLLTVRRNTGGDYRIFAIENGAVTLEGLTISNGFLPASGNLGGGIFNDGGTLIVTKCALIGNHAYAGGGLYVAGLNGASTTVTGCTLSGNSASEGGGIDNVAIGGEAILSVSNSTFSGNTASNSGGAIANGTLGGSVSLTLTNCTLSGNSAPSGGGVNNGVFFGGSATVLVRNTIFKTGASGVNLINSSGIITSQGSNRSNDSGGGFLVGSGDLTNTDPLIGVLQNNGGPTFTHALLAGSNAINNGNAAFAPSVDQRGYTRNGASDIGAFEFGGAPPPTPTPTPPPPPTPTPSPTPSPTPTATPTPSPSPMPITISGTVTYCSNPSANPVPNVTLTLTGSGSGSTLSTGSGNYQFSALASGGSYTVTPTKLVMTPGSAGINTIDMIAAQRHFLAVVPLAGCQLTAADVSGEGDVNTIDVIAIQRFFLGLSTGVANTGKYQFTPASRSYAGLLSNQTAQNYDTLVLGDVATAFVHRPESDPAKDGMTDDASASASSELNPSAGEIPSSVTALSLPDITIDAAMTHFVAAVTTAVIDGKNNLVGFQGDFTFDERVVVFQSPPVQPAGLTVNNWNVSGNVMPGTGPIRTLRLSAYSLDFTPLAGTGTLFELRMTRVNDATREMPLIWAEPPDHFIFIDTDLNMQRPADTMAGSVTLLPSK